MRKLYFVILIAIISSQVDAQSFIKFTRTNLGTIPAIDTNQAFAVSDSVYNTSSNTFSGIISYNATVNGTLLGIFDTTIISTPLDTGGTPNTGQPVFFHLPFGNNAFVSGPNLIVVWPLYNGGHAGPDDSIRVIIDISYVAGIVEAPLAKAYIIQRSGMLNINLGDNEDLVQQVSLYDIQGQRIYSGTARQSQSIPTSNWSEGIYFCEITTYKGERRTIKFVLRQQP